MSLIAIFALALFPLLLSLILLGRIQRRLQARSRRRDAIAAYRLQLPRHSSFNEEISDLPDPYIGDSSCRYNARSPYLRCAVNPDGPCEECPTYQARYPTTSERDPKF